MRLGIIGSGDVGMALGRGFIKYGHHVMIGSRSPKSEKVTSWVHQAGARASGGTFEEAAEYGEVIVLAVAWSGCENAIGLAGKKHFSGKTVLDVTNPLVFEEGKPPRLAIGHTDSGGEQIQRWLPEAHIVKVFNIVGNAHMVDPDFPDGPPDMFICGNNGNAKETVTEICELFGWSVIDIGGIEGARELEPLCILWVKYGMLTQSWDHAFKLLRKSG
ncbi:NAD(P)-binding domain-containing protein [Aliifodinibius sp. S!AR15-10]|uniref:NADPH-dependent F420 reductase n=1 Tax=Aliifodinibius sp. S!AR15-10 TaxID=2950437 RepID=UPI00285B7A19|nr:NAD(P)-binding domain-containing protein [Aliifodinibius sp. S!AR15-10]MDR8391516.1 NAD(P)-binding domain-containing protein [Aliifodinibius sp. S!AR15-10]